MKSGILALFTGTGACPTLVQLLVLLLVLLPVLVLVLLPVMLLVKLLALPPALMHKQVLVVVLALVLAPTQHIETALHILQGKPRQTFIPHE